jgi:hypothetical protein
VESRDAREGLELIRTDKRFPTASWTGFILIPAPHLADHLSQHGFRISRTRLWRRRYSPPDFFVWSEGRVVAKFSGTYSVSTIIYAAVEPHFISIARQYGTVSFAGHPFEGNARGPDVTGKAVAGMVFRNVLVVVSAALFLTLSRMFG